MVSLLSSASASQAASLASAAADPSRYLLCPRVFSIDNSEWSRNGDYAPSRFAAQKESINYIAAAKIQSNAETTVGLLSLAGDRIDVHISPSRSPGAIMTALAKDVRIQGEANFVSGLKTAALALKNRQNKNQRQRIILFAGSPVREDVKELLRLAKALRKNNVAVDVINFGAENAANESADKWEQFIDAVNASDNSRLVNVPPGPHILSDMILSSAIMQEEGGGGGRGAAGAGAGAAGLGFGDMDPSQDQDMAQAIRMSLEEERARQQRLAAEAAGPGPGTAAAAAGQPTAASAGSDGGVPMEDDDEAQQLQQAIAMSMLQQQETPQQDAQTPAADSSMSSSTASAPATAAASASSSGPASSAAPDTAAHDVNADIDAAMQDPDFINSLLASVTGSTGSSTADTDSMLDQLTAQPEKKEEKKDDAAK